MKWIGWTKEQDARLIELWNDGKSATDIAKFIEGKTRNSIIGRANRLRAAGTVLAQHERGRQAGGPFRPRIRLGGLPKPRKPRAQPLADTLEGSVFFFDVTGCKWPVTQSAPHRFCNRDRHERGPYCEGHLVRATSFREMKRGKYEVPFQ